MSEENRQHPRFAIELDAEIIADDGDSIVGRTRDLSKGGFCMLSRGSMPVGTACKVKLALVFQEGQFSEHLTLPSTVVWCTPVQGVQQIGVKFAPLDPQNRGYLDMFIKFLETGQEDDAEEEEEETSDDEVDPGQ
jgi:hypothetical protein